MIRYFRRWLYRNDCCTRDDLLTLHERLNHIDKKLHKREIRIMSALSDLTEIILEVADSTAVLRDRVVAVTDLLANVADRYEDDDLLDAITKLREVDVMIDASAGKLQEAADTLDSDPEVVLVEPEVITVPSDVPGQPATDHPDGVVEGPFPTEGFPEEVDMTSPKPHGEEPTSN
jgi:hypothetical protein